MSSAETAHSVVSVNSSSLSICQLLQICRFVGVDPFSFFSFCVSGNLYFMLRGHYPVSILHISIAGCYRPVRVADGPITARSRLIKNASWLVGNFIYIFGVIQPLPFAALIQQTKN